MPLATLDAGGGVDDVCRIVLGQDEIHIAEGYEIHLSILDVPATFAVQIGHVGAAAELIRRYPPNTEFKLYINDALQFGGRTDGYAAPGGNGTVVELRGRDYLAPLHDAFIREEKSFENQSYLDLVQVALAEAGVRPGGVVHHDNAANRKTITGANVRGREPKNVEEIVVEKGKGGLVYKTVHAKLSERWLDFVRTHLDRAGLRIWAAANGDWVLSSPNIDQEPLYEIALSAQTPIDSNGFRGGVRRDHYENGVQPPRYSEVIVYSRVGAKKYGRGKVKGKFVDEEMIALGIDRPLSIRDANVASIEQAERLAERKLAEGRRATFNLQYSTHGHSARGPDGQRAIWSPDTLVRVRDEQVGLAGDFYVDSVTHRRNESSGTTSSFKLSRKGDIVIGADEDE